MENLDPNQLPMLPDPTEGPALPNPVAKPAPTTPTPTITPETLWFRTKQGKLILGVGAAVAVVLVFLFSQQLGQLLNLFGTKAGTTQTVELSNSETAASKFRDEGWTATPNQNYFDVVDGKLMLNYPGESTL